MSDVDVWCGVSNSVLFPRSIASSGHPGMALGVFCKHIPCRGPGGHSKALSYSSAGRYMQLISKKSKIYYSIAAIPPRGRIAAQIPDERARRARVRPPSASVWPLGLAGPRCSTDAACRACTAARWEK